MIRLMSFIAVALIMELIFFGPVGLNIYNIPVRKALMAALLACSIVPMITEKPLAVGQIVLFSAIIVFLVIWGGVVPMTNGVPLQMSVAEVQPLVALLLILPFYYLFRHDGIGLYLTVVRRCVAAIATIVIVVWAASNLFGRADIGIAMRQFYISLNDTDTGVYIGPMSDGSFRVMLINFILFPLMLCYYNWERTNIPWSAFYMLAILATGTRAFLAVGAMIVGISLLRRRPFIAVIGVAAIAIVAVLYINQLDRFRIFEFNSELTSSSARYMQFFSLLNLFWQYPLFGAGFGAHAVVIRSLEAPYSYELTYVALLAKLGIVGSGIIILAATMWGARLISLSRNWTSIASLIIAVFLMTSTNPYLINLVGMSIVSFIIALGTQVDRSKRGGPELGKLPSQGSV